MNGIIERTLRRLQPKEVAAVAEVQKPKEGAKKTKRKGAKK